MISSIRALAFVAPLLFSHISIASECEKSAENSPPDPRVIQVDSVKAAAIEDFKTHRHPRVLMMMLKALFRSAPIPGLKNEEGEDVVLEVSSDGQEHYPDFCTLSFNQRCVFDLRDDDSIERVLSTATALDVIIYPGSKNIDRPPYMRLTLKFDKTKKLEKLSVAHKWAWINPFWTTETVIF